MFLMIGKTPDPPQRNRDSSSIKLNVLIKVKFFLMVNISAVGNPELSSQLPDFAQFGAFYISHLMLHSL